MTLRVAILILLAAGALVLAFPRPAIYPLAFLALVPVLHASARARSRSTAFRIGWATGFVAHMGLLWWIARLYPTEITYPAMRLPALILLAGFEGVFYGVALWAWRVVSSTGRWWLWPGLWVTTEYARSLTSIAFPWTVLANALAPQPLLLQPAALGGVWLLDLGVATINVLLVRSAARPRHVIPALLIVGCWIGGGAVAMGRDTTTLRVGIVQPNALPEYKWHQGGRSRVLRDLEILSLAAAESLSGGGDRLVVWPETALPLVVKPGGGAEFWLTRLVDDLDIPVITGALGATGNGEGQLTNAAVMVVPRQGITGRYDKIHLVPFSEKMPFSDAFPAIKKINFGQGDYARGTMATPLEVHGRRISVLICFEAILPALVRHHIAHGGQLLVNITNDSWFGQSGAPEQHAAIAVVRAVEHRRWMVRAANTGVSLIADPWGRVVTRGGQFKPEILVGAVRPRSDRTLYSHTGDWAAWLGILAWLLIVGDVRRRP